MSEATRQDTAPPDLFRDVGAFHAKFDLPRFGVVVPNFLTQDVFDFRDKFIAEEHTELKYHRGTGDMPGTIDAIVDQVYVLLGTAHMMGFDFNAHWNEVHTKNMQKERATGADDPRSTRPHALNVVKPAGWTPPLHDDIIGETFAACAAAGVTETHGAV